MTEKRFKLRLSKLGNGMISDTKRNDDLFFDKEFLEPTLKKTVDWLNELSEENEQLKQQLFCNAEEGVCIICKHHYLVSNTDSELGYYNSRCKKGHYECAKMSLKYCEDFEKELQE